MHLKSILVTALLLAPIGAAMAAESAAQAQGACLSQAAQRRAVSSGEAQRPGRIGKQLGGKVLRLSLCEGNGGLTWRFTILQGDGRVVDRVVDAKSGQPIR